MKKIVTIQDISCVGKCSLTVALPILSAMGIETAIIPTAVLSTHTLFKGFTFHDLTGEINPIKEHWKKEGFSFDSIYTGYMGSEEQIDIVMSLIKDFKTPDTLVVVDPAMADGGKLYEGFSSSFPLAMAKLCSVADVILPNLTEAAFLLGEEYNPGKMTEKEVERILKKLSKLGAKKVVLKGLMLENMDDNKVGIASYDSSTGEIEYYFHERVNAAFHGTGDVFASVFTGAMLNGFDIKNSYSLAGDFVLRTIKSTMSEKNYHTWGVDFEKELPWLIKKIN